MYTVETHEDKAVWDALVLRKKGHPLQLWGWGEVKAKHGWRAVRLAIRSDDTEALVAQVLLKPLPKPFGCIAYIPRGPIGRDKDALNALVIHVKKAFRPVCITAEPDTVGELPWDGWRMSSNRILLARTAVMDLTDNEDDLMARMNKKTRQYIRKSGDEGVVVRTARNETDILECLRIYKSTAERAGFALHDDSYYLDIFNELSEQSPVFMAEKEGRVVAFLWPIITDEVAFELYGGMNEEGQALRANYHLKWNVIQEMKRRGIVRYDLNGLLNDGVTTFKKGFIPDETMMSGSFDMPLSPLYTAWTTLLPAAKKIVRTIKR